LVLATEIAGVGGLDLPVEVSAIDSFPSVTDAPERSLSIVARISLDLSDVYMNNDASVAQALDRCKHVSLFLLERADAWLDDDEERDHCPRRVTSVLPPHPPTPKPLRPTRHTPGDDVELEHRDGLTVAELIDILSQHPADAIVEMSIIAPVREGDDDITVD